MFLAFLLRLSTGLFCWKFQHLVHRRGVLRLFASHSWKQNGCCLSVSLKPNIAFSQSSRKFCSITFPLAIKLLWRIPTKFSNKISNRRSKSLVMGWMQPRVLWVSVSSLKCKKHVRWPTFSVKIGEIINFTFC